MLIYVWKLPSGKLLTMFFGEEIDWLSNLYLNSEQSESCKSSIMFYQVMCLMQIWTTEEDFKEESEVLAERMIERGYGGNVAIQ